MVCKSTYKYDRANILRNILLIMDGFLCRSTFCEREIYVVQLCQTEAEHVAAGDVEGFFTSRNERLKQMEIKWKSKQEIIMEILVLPQM